MLYCRSNILLVLDRALARMTPHLCGDENEMAKQHQKLTRYVILFVLKDKTERIFHLL